MWKFIAASEIGTSHQLSGAECQDNHYVEQLQIASQTWLIAIAADGAGSVLRGGQGAALACYALSQFLVSQLQSLPEQTLTQEIIEQGILAVRTVITSQAQANDLQMRDYATTLLGAVIGPSQAIFFQIGDGAIVVSRQGYQGVVFWPENGLYANMTYFVTDDDYLQHLQIQELGVSVDDVVVFTDGLQRLALSFEYKVAHRPFFEPILNALRQTKLDDCVLLSQHVNQFLSSAQVNKRTDDDKTLIMATRAT